MTDPLTTPFSHAPSDYICPFCLVAQRQSLPDIETHPDDIFYQTEYITAFVASRWWPNNPGHALIIPNQHIENIYDLVPEIAVYVHEASRQVALAFKHIYGADAPQPVSITSLRGIRRCFTIICMCFRAIPTITCTICHIIGGKPHARNGRCTWEN